MRKIKFRGLRKEHKEDGYQSKWRAGNLLNECSIGEVGFGLDSYSFAEVLPETIGQFTGLQDKNGVDIYEGDVVRILYTDWMSKSDWDERTLEQYKIDMSAKGVVMYKDCEFGLRICSDLLDSLFEGAHGEKEVIGNIHENPELLND